MKLIIHLHLLPRLRVSGAIHLPFLYPFVTWTRNTTLLELSSFGWFLIHIQISVWNMECIKIMNAQQAKSTYVYRNTKQELLKKNASIWFSKTCQMNHLTPKYMNITINDNNQLKFYPIIWISVLWSNLTHSVTLYPCNKYPEDGRITSQNM